MELFNTYKMKTLRLVDNQLYESHFKEKFQ